MKILALDQKVSGCGWCLAEDDEYLNSFYHKTKGVDAWDKIDNLSIWLQGWLNLFSVDCLVLEYPSGNKGSMDTNIKLGAVLYSCIWTFRWWWARRHNENPVDAPIVIVRPTEVKATGIYKDQLDQQYKKFEIPKKKDGTVNKAALSRIGDELDAIGVWLAGLKKIKENQDD